MASSRTILTGIEPDPTKDAVLGAGARGNFYRSKSIYRALVIKNTDGYSKVSASDYRKKRDFVTNFVILPILRKGGRFLVIEKCKESRGSTNQSLDCNHGTRYYELDLKNYQDRKTVVKAIQQAMRDEIKARVRKKLKEQREQFADAPEEGHQLVTTEKATSSPRVINLMSPSKVKIDELKSRKKLTTDKRRSNGIVLPTRRKNLLPLNRRTSDNNDICNGDDSDSDSAQIVTQRSPVTHAPSSPGLNSSIQRPRENSTTEMNSSVAASQNHRLSPSLNAIAMDPSYSGDSNPTTVNTNDSRFSDLNVMASQQQSAWVVPPQMAHTLSKMSPEQQQLYFANYMTASQTEVYQNPFQPLQLTTATSNNNNTVYFQQAGGTSMMAATFPKQNLLEQQQQQQQQLQFRQQLLLQQEQMKLQQRQMKLQQQMQSMQQSFSMVRNEPPTTAKIHQVGQTGEHRLF